MWAVSSAPLPNVAFHHLLPFSLRFEDVLDCVAESAVAAAVRCDVVRIAFDLIAGVSYGDRQAAIPHDRKIDHVVTDECDLSRLDPFLNDDFAKDAELVLNALVNVFEFQVAGAQGNRFGDALGDEPIMALKAGLGR